MTRNPDYPARPRTFLNLPTVAYEEARAGFLPIPWEGTTTFGAGTRFGPEAIISASANIEQFDNRLLFDPAKHGIITMDPVEPIAGNAKAMVERVRETFFSFLADDTERFWVLLGGEHTTTVGAVHAAKLLFPYLSVLQIDAHLDLRDKYEETRWSHACTMHHILKKGIRFVPVGIRSFTEFELHLLQSRGGSSRDALDLRPPDEVDDTERVTIFADEVGREGWIEKALYGLTKHVYLNIDVDGLDPSIMPSTGTPEPGGLTFQQLDDLIAALFESGKRVVAADIVELAPIPGLRAPDVLCAKLAWRIIAHALSRKQL